MKCYHTTTKDRVINICKIGLQPNSKPTWFSRPTPYIMLSKQPWKDLNGDNSIVLEIEDPTIECKHFYGLDEGVRWPFIIEPKYIKIYSGE